MKSLWQQKAKIHGPVLVLMKRKHVWASCWVVVDTTCIHLFFFMMISQSHCSDKQKIYGQVLVLMKREKVWASLQVVLTQLLFICSYLQRHDKDVAVTNNKIYMYKFLC